MAVGVVLKLNFLLVHMVEQAIEQSRTLINECMPASLTKRLYPVLLDIIRDYAFELCVRVRPTCTKVYVMMFGYIHGKLTSIGLDGKVEEVSYYVDNTITRWYYQDDQLSSVCSYYDEILHGMQKRYWYNGKIRLIQRYNHGDKHGIKIEWYFNGKLKQCGRYSNNVKVGVWRTWPSTVFDFFC